MQRCLRLPLVLFLIAVCAAPHTAIAQQETATMTGTVTDPTGAVVPGATVTSSVTVPVCTLTSMCATCATCSVTPFRTLF